ncbi:MAG: diguanylate cyclase [Anaerolineales bacterium]|nr:MAG: diguanylate cyclase [Anaerolineales bacterium]
MQFQLHPFAIYLFISAAITLVASGIAWRRSAPGSFTLSYLLLSMTIWSGAFATRLLNISFEQKLFWFHVMYVGIITMPNIFLAFILKITSHERWFSRPYLFLFFIQPALSLLLLWTNQFHRLYYESITATEVSGMVMFDFVRGPWYFVNLTYSYAVVLLALGVMFYSALRLGPLFRSQYRLILIGSVIPWVGSIYSEINFDQFRGLDITPVTFGITGILFAFAVARSRFMDLVPVARSLLIENMSDGLLMLDTINRVVDFNPAMHRFLGGNPSTLLGRHISELLGDWLADSDSFLSESESQVEMLIPDEPPRYLDLRVTPLFNAYRNLSGRLIVFRDITDRKDVEKKLRIANRQLQSQLIEIGTLQSKLREQAIRDPLTNLFNRRYLEETLDRELARAAREKYSVSIVLIDIDHFKQVNDTYGHEAGDVMLKAIAQVLTSFGRRGDFACRYGGEEFVVAMPNLPIEVAYGRAETLRASLNSLQAPYNRYILTATFSMGIASSPANGETRESLLRSADKALYKVKQSGRDDIRSFDELESIGE